LRIQLLLGYSSLRIQLQQGCNSFKDTTIAGLEQLAGYHFCRAIASSGPQQLQGYHFCRAIAGSGPQQLQGYHF
jgi:hypothetical protein